MTGALKKKELIGNIDGVSSCALMMFLFFLILKIVKLKNLKSKICKNQANLFKILKNQLKIKFLKFSSQSL
jgi:hypothetical protein